MRSTGSSAESRRTARRALKKRITPEAWRAGRSAITKEALFISNSASPLYRPGPALAEQAAELRGAGLVAGEDLLEVCDGEVTRGDLAEHVAEVCSECEVAPLEELVVAQARPLAVDLPAAHRAADD